MAAVTPRSGHKAGKRGNQLPWAKPGHNGVHPESVSPDSKTCRRESGGDVEPRPKIVRG